MPKQDSDSPKRMSYARQVARVLCFLLGTSGCYVAIMAFSFKNETGKSWRDVALLTKQQAYRSLFGEQETARDKSLRDQAIALQVALDTQRLETRRAEREAISVTAELKVAREQIAALDQRVNDELAHAEHERATAESAASANRGVPKSVAGTTLVQSPTAVDALATKPALPISIRSAKKNRPLTELTEVATKTITFRGYVFEGLWCVEEKLTLDVSDPANVTGTLAGDGPGQPSKIHYETELAGTFDENAGKLTLVVSNHDHHDHLVSKLDAKFDARDRVLHVYFSSSPSEVQRNRYSRFESIPT